MINSYDVIKNIFRQKNRVITILFTFITVIIFYLVFSKFIAPSFEEQIMLNVIDESKKISHHINRSYKIEKDFSHLEDLKKDFNLDKIRFFDKKGEILYSTKASEIGTINEKDYYHNIVAKGKTYYKIVKNGKKTLDGTVGMHDVAEVYVPIMKNGTFLYAFEIYYDVSNKVNSFDQLIFKIQLVNYLIMFLVFFVVFVRLYSESKLNIKENMMQLQLYKSDKMASMGEMIGNIAHQWRQPLSVISTGVTGMLVQKQHGMLNDELFKKTCQNINKNTQYLSKTIDDFKNYIKGDSVITHFNIQDTIEQFLHLVEATIEKENINVVLNIDDTIMIHGYSNELIQCFINLFNNAKDILVHQSKDKRHFFIKVTKKNQNVIIHIKDTGAGIDEDIIDKIFEPYFTTKHESQGTGLGLHMTYDLIVNGLGGKIEVRNTTFTYNSIQYVGVEFEIIIPLNQVKV